MTMMTMITRRVRQPFFSSDESESDTSDESEETEPLEIDLNEPKKNGRCFVILVPRETSETKLRHYFDASTHADELFALLPQVFDKAMTINVDYELKCMFSVPISPFSIGKGRGD